MSRRMNLKGITVQGIGRAGSDIFSSSWFLSKDFAKKSFSKIFLRNVASAKLTFSKKRVFSMGTHTQVATVKPELHTKRNTYFVCKFSLLSLKI